MLTFVGALIVFSTFIVKDALKEQLRDFGDSIDKAESLYLVREDTMAILKELQPLQRQPYYNEEIQNPPQRLKRLGDFADLVKRDHELNHMAVLKSEDLLTRLPESVRRQDESDLNSINEKYASDHATLREWDERYFKSGLSSRRVTTAQEDLIVGLELIGGEFEGITSTFTAKVLAQARQVEASNERRYEIATWASWFLYVLGWGLGLAGRLVGVEGIGDGGD